ncbi:MAG: hypothetical protein F6K41_24140 [Symploca sp. SIO3E6]|nr:hypothetical protein [Caldora sp. SIO3E6]
MGNGEWEMYLKDVRIAISSIPQAEDLRKSVKNIIEKYHKTQYGAYP